MEKTVEFLNKVIEEFSDVTWGISRIENFKEIVDGEAVYAKLEDGSTFDKQDDFYIHQTQHGDDWFSGTIIYPITDNQALVIHYSC